MDHLGYKQTCNVDTCSIKLCKNNTAEWHLSGHLKNRTPSTSEFQTEAKSRIGQLVSKDVLQPRTCRWIFSMAWKMTTSFLFRMAYVQGRRRLVSWSVLGLSLQLMGAVQLDISNDSDGDHPAVNAGMCQCKQSIHPKVQDLSIKTATKIERMSLHGTASLWQTTSASPYMQ